MDPPRIAVTTPLLLGQHRMALRGYQYLQNDCITTNVLMRSERFAYELPLLAATAAISDAPAVTSRPARPTDRQRVIAIPAALI